MTLTRGFCEACGIRLLRYRLSRMLEEYNVLSAISSSTRPCVQSSPHVSSLHSLTRPGLIYAYYPPYQTPSRIFLAYTLYAEVQLASVPLVPLDFLPCVDLQWIAST
ncbi:hypothetical protein BDN70DRAFT_288973 [Pholiota conissans]|uniref:Uncharacterized protein n=1 Tax=Pholiota conissans TaxID=109636 RepID=A0A9P5YTK2_9AGAR|nr:hypothetical protein BDN70DRAFT_288973 [Pholiota conissans]